VTKVEKVDGVWDRGTAGDSLLASANPEPDVLVNEQPQYAEASAIAVANAETRDFGASTAALQSLSLFIAEKSETELLLQGRANVETETFTKSNESVPALRP
jgi:hypothetical protein